MNDAQIESLRQRIVRLKAASKVHPLAFNEVYGWILLASRKPSDREKCLNYARSRLSELEQKAGLQ